jgi:hypothetical protein
MRQSFSHAQIAEFLRRSYFAVDGLWFVKAEDRHGFDEAMELDAAVWDVMSKIQARKAKSVLGIEGGSLEELANAFQLKLAAEGHDYDVERRASEVVFTVRVCPWYEILKSGNRTHIAEIIADRICRTEFAGWAREFGPDIRLEMRKRLCVESDQCSQCEIAFVRP